MPCELCDTINWKEDENLRIIECNTCHIKMLVLREHRQFTEAEKTLIECLNDVGAFGEGRYGDHRKIRWEQRKIKDHAHCHFE